MQSKALTMDMANERILLIAAVRLIGALSREFGPPEKAAMITMPEYRAFCTAFGEAAGGPAGMLNAISTFTSREN